MKTVSDFACFNIILAISFVTVSACSCFHPTPPPCYVFGKSDTVFVGSVKEFTHLGELSLFDNIEIDVERVFKGLKEKQIRSISSRYDSACGNNFRKDAKYLFYGSLSKDGRTYNDGGICWRTQPYDESSPDFDFLNLVNDAKPLFWVFGTFTTGWGTEGLQGMRAEVFDGKKKKIAYSDKDGIVKMPVAKAGKYLVRVVLPNKMQFGRSDWMWNEEIRPKIQSKKGIETIEYIVDVKPNQCGWFDVPVFIDKK